MFAIVIRTPKSPGFNYVGQKGVVASESEARDFPSLQSANEFIDTQGWTNSSRFLQGETTAYVCPKNFWKRQP